MALSAVIGEMQAVKQDYEALDVPACAERLHAADLP